MVSLEMAYLQKKPYESNSSHQPIKLLNPKFLLLFHLRKT